MNYAIFPSHVCKVTDKSFQVRIEDELIWLPKSQTKALVRENNGHKEYKVILPYWLADEKGFFAKAYNGMNLYHIQATDETI